MLAAYRSPSKHAMVVLTEHHDDPGVHSIPSGHGSESEHGGAQKKIPLVPSKVFTAEEVPGQSVASSHAPHRGTHWFFRQLSVGAHILHGAPQPLSPHALSEQSECTVEHTLHFRTSLRDYTVHTGL